MSLLHASLGCSNSPTTLSNQEDDSNDSGQELDDDDDDNGEDDSTDEESTEDDATGDDSASGDTGDPDALLPTSWTYSEGGIVSSSCSPAMAVFIYADEMTFSITDQTESSLVGSTLEGSMSTAVTGSRDGNDWSLQTEPVEAWGSDPNVSDDGNSCHWRIEHLFSGTASPFACTGQTGTVTALDEENVGDCIAWWGVAPGTSCNSISQATCSIPE